MATIISNNVVSKESILANDQMLADAFGRLRTSDPLTLFDSSHRFEDNGLWNKFTASGGSSVFNVYEGSVDLKVNTSSGSEVIRETKKVFSYQPGKSLLILNTFVFAPEQDKLRQRVGYFGDNDGIYFQLESQPRGILSFVERSSVSGSVVENQISQFGGSYGPLDTGWNVDRLDGTGPSGIIIDITKAQIMFMDIEWLGAGTVRVGFVINGVFIVCHKFHHANLISSTYITTACLPLRYEITNTGITTAVSTMKQICSSVISEGGYELRGKQQAIGTPITTPVTFSAAGTFYPMLGLKLTSTKLDAIAVLTAASILGLGNGKNYAWRVVQGASISGGTWVSMGANSAVEYNLTGTSSTGGEVIAQGYISSSNQASPTINILKDTLFATQLERDNFTGTAFEIVIEMAIDSIGGLLGAYASVNWEEITR